MIDTELTFKIWQVIPNSRSQTHSNTYDRPVSLDIPEDEIKDYVQSRFGEVTAVVSFPNGIP